jgi:SAM-dependent methyltransferase
MNGHSQQLDSWASGKSYEQYVGRWSRLVAAEFIGWLGAPPQQHWLDVGCGTGALIRTILERTSPAAVHGIDPSKSHVAYARDSIRDDRVTFDVGTVESAQHRSSANDVVVSGLVLNFMPDPLRAVAHMKRVTRKGGVIAAYVWDYAGKMELMRYFWNAAAALDQSAIALDEGERFPLCRPEPLKELFTATGLEGVDVRPIDIPTRFNDFEDYWTPFLGGQGPAPGYTMSLSEERRKVLRDRIRSELPVAHDGSINLTARAWAVKGTTP